MSLIQTAALSKIYTSGLFKKKNVNALDKVSLEVPKGKIFGLLGPNGAGKTTFVKLILSIIRPTGGTATVMGHQLGSVEIRKLSGYLPENHRYPPFLTGRETLRMFGRLNGISPARLKSHADELLGMVGLSEWANVRTKKYSKGMLQRLGLAQALLNDPELLFLDEPTDGVDPIGRKEIRDLLVQLKLKGTTIFINSHLLQEVELVCDRVVILNKGSIVKEGTVAELTATEPVYEIQLETPPPADLLHELEARAFSVTAKDSTLFARTKSTEELNSLIDLLRASGCSLGSVGKQKVTLEDSFIQLIQGGTRP